MTAGAPDGGGGAAAAPAAPPLASHSLKANAWLVIFSFVGNYWYTHYFYSVLRAEYTFPAHDLNGVPVAMFFATHFYFALYHTLASCALRRARRAFAPSRARAAFCAALVLAMSYATAFTETLTIAGFPCYRFDDWHAAATLGSAFYGLYFVVSYPTYARLDEVFDDGFAEDAGGAPRGGGEPPGGTAARRVTRLSLIHI